MPKAARASDSRSASPAVAEGDSGLKVTTWGEGDLDRSAGSALVGERREDGGHDAVEFVSRRRALVLSLRWLPLGAGVGAPLPTGGAFQRPRGYGGECEHPGWEGLEARWKGVGSALEVHSARSFVGSRTSRWRSFEGDPFVSTWISLRLSSRSIARAKFGLLTPLLSGCFANTDGA